MFNQKLRTEVLQKVLWDTHLTPDQANTILTKEENSDEKKALYLKLLYSTNWYTLLKILSEPELKDALDASIINSIHIPSLKSKYTYAREILFR